MCDTIIPAKVCDIYLLRFGTCLSVAIGSVGRSEKADEVITNQSINQGDRQTQAAKSLSIRVSNIVDF